MNESAEDIKDQQQSQLKVAVPPAEGAESSGPFQGIPRIFTTPKLVTCTKQPSAAPQRLQHQQPPPSHKKKLFGGQTSIISSHLRLGRSRGCLPDVFRPQLTTQCVLHSQPIQTHVNFIRPRYGPTGQQCQGNVYQPYNKPFPAGVSARLPTHVCVMRTWHD
jgi:hypothetical protein